MNKIKWFLWIVIAFLAYTGFVAATLHNSKEYPIDVIAVNDISQSLAELALTEGWEGLGQTELPGREYGLNYVVLDSMDHYIAATRQGLNTDRNSAIRNRDTIVNITNGDTLLGKLILYNDTADIWNRHRVHLLVIAEIIFLSVAAFCLLYTIYMEKTILAPFRKLKSFAGRVAAGNLDIPLTMDRGNQFGAFTESFDLMRDELNKARENEKKANQSKKELVASLSHDIKTPVASIMAVAELMAAKSGDDHDKKQLEIINSKAEQINTLIMNMFSATLEELEELKVAVAEQSSHRIYELLKVTDYQKRVSCSQSSECLVLMDEQRLAQVIDNIISNSYKYANTTILVTDVIIGDYLEITFQDYGAGVPEEERALLCNKFYRASNSVGKSGSGLGLYISKYLMNKMSGDLECENRQDGFAVILRLRVA